MESKTLPVETQVALLRKMLWIRRVQEKIVELYPQQQMRCPVHLCIGQEANSAGMVHAMRDEDLVYGGHRYHGPYLSRGGSLERMFAEFYGKETGCTSGIGGSMHLIDRSKGVEGAVPILGGSLSIAAGAAFVQKLRKTDRVVVAFIGDAIVEEGLFHEVMNLASVKGLPLLIYCENNELSTMTPIRERQPSRALAEIGKAHAVRSWKVDGNDVLAVHQVALEAMSYVRAESRPGFIEANTYRWREHCGPSYDIDQGYRSADELEQWRKKCPVEQLKKSLVAAGHVTEKQYAEWITDTDRKVQEAARFAQESPFPPAAKLHRDVFARESLRIF